jgi:hypothetical protein
MKGVVGAGKPQFTQINFINMWEFALVAYVRQSDQHALSNWRTSHIACGVMNVIGNKGGVQIRFNLYDHGFTFLNCHLAPGAFHLKQRVDMF